MFLRESWNYNAFIIEKEVTGSTLEWVGAEGNQVSYLINTGSQRNRNYDINGIYKYRRGLLS